MGSYLSTSKGAAAEADAPIKCDSPVYATAEVQKVTFADPPASVAKAPATTTPSGPPEPVLKREGARKGRTPRAAVAAAATPLSERPKRSAARTPRAAAAAPSPAAAPAASPAPAAAAAAAATPRAVRRAAAGKKKASGKAGAAAVAAPAPELVVVGRAMRQKGAVPARKVGMKRVAKRALYPVNASAGRPSRSKK